ncbi:hypothetical protein [Tenacibaculum sp. 1_MG-2023]|uniref:hypothetical protein n=1 Tax=Tenacibaculum sp. 1_MG-2023 TaxID=3062653 RepID=UPI0026E432D8|nr:hypothetical protein [Tenacibaculum sp. 1_MG-2023]MDO6600642.1 hypothetical protein [Tenacibaculum sp. 1_MG-2023]
MNLEKENKLIEKQFSDIAKTIIQNKSNNSFYHKLTFNTNQLIDHKNYTDYPNSKGDLVDQFKPLNIIKENHCLYWFELNSNEETIKINELLNNYRLKKDQLGNKTVPAKNTYKSSSKEEIRNVLYLGVRQGGYVKSKKLTNIVGRLNQHLGYYKVKSTQGLQLYEYAKGKDFDITIKVIEFEGLNPKYLNIIENEVAKVFKPLSGRH